MTDQQTVDPRAALEARVAELRARDEALEAAAARPNLEDPVPVVDSFREHLAELERRKVDDPVTQEREQARIRAAELAALEERKVRWRRIVPEDYWATTLDNLPANTAPVLGRLRAYAAAVVADRRTAGNLVLTGELGAGKSSAAAGIGRYVSDAGGTVRMVLVGEWVTELQASFGRTLPDCFGYDLLILDDLGEQRAPSPFVLDQLYNLINRYRVDRRCLLVTTNLRPLAERHPAGHPKAGQPVDDARGLDLFLSAATYDRLRHNLQVVTITGPSNRRTRRELEAAERA